MKKGTIIKCIVKGGHYSITTGHLYVVHESGTAWNNVSIRIMNDYGQLVQTLAYRFQIIVEP